MEDIILRLAVIEKTDTEEVERAVRTTALKFLPEVIIFRSFHFYFRFLL